MEANFKGTNNRQHSTNTQHNYSQSTDANETRGYGNTVNYDRSDGTSYAENNELRDQSGFSSSNRDSVSNRRNDTAQIGVIKTTNSARGDSGGITASADLQRLALTQARSMHPDMSDNEFLLWLSKPENRMAVMREVQRAAMNDSSLNPAEQIPMQNDALADANEDYGKAEAHEKELRNEMDVRWEVGHGARSADKPEPKAPPAPPQPLMNREEYEAQKADLEQDFNLEASVHKQYYGNVGLWSTVNVTHLGGAFYDSPEEIRKGEEEKK